MKLYTETPKSLKLIDAYMVYILLTGIIQFVYVVIAGTFPNNAFLAGFISTVAGFVLAGMHSPAFHLSFDRLPKKSGTERMVV
jgi:uncharacterized membrane protein (DUF485 family)